MKWLQEHTAELAKLPPGEWVAVDGNALIAHAPDLETVMQLARRAGHPSPLVVTVPREPERKLHL